MHKISEKMFFNMRIRLLLSLGFLFACSNIQASALVDSVGVENLDGKKVILHKVEAHETYYSIGHKYSVNPRLISDYYSKNILKIGTILKVPTDVPFETIKAKKSNSLIEYTVSPKETLFSIAKKFGMTVVEVQELNHLSSTDIQIGEILKVRNTPNISNTSQISPTKIASENNIEPTRIDTTDTEIDENNNTNPLKLPPSKYGLHELNERGIALCLSDESLDGSQMLALHRTAPIGTVIKITNPMTQKSTFAKVVGKFTENESTKNVIIVITKSVADLIGALDKKFQVNLTYGVPNG